MVANTVNIVALATETSLAVTKLWLDFTQTPSPDRRCNWISPIASPLTPGKYLGHLFHYPLISIDNHKSCSAVPSGCHHCHSWRGCSLLQSTLGTSVENQSNSTAPSPWQRSLQVRLWPDTAKSSSSMSINLSFIQAICVELSLYFDVQHHNGQTLAVFFAALLMSNNLMLFSQDWILTDLVWNSFNIAGTCLCDCLFDLSNSLFSYSLIHYFYS